MKFLWLNLLLFKAIFALSKTFDTIFLRPEDFNPIKVAHEAKSEEMCRFSCVWDDCVAFTFKEAELKRIFGNFDGVTDPIYLARGYGMKIYVDVNSKPAKHPHIAIFGGYNEVDMDISMQDETSTSTPWFPVWPAPDQEWHPVGMFYQEGFLVCGGSGDLNCHHLKLGASSWTTVESIPHSGSAIAQMGYLALGSNTFYVNAGWETGPGFHTQGKTFFNWKWKNSVQLTTPFGVDRHCMVRIDHRRVSQGFKVKLIPFRLLSHILRLCSLVAMI